jgi:aryl-alcohol dehydrogenase-like predicted oxidoreductase
MSVRLGGVALGCGNFGGVGSAPAFFGQGIARDEAFRIMDRAWQSGITWFDTADAYGGGASETWIGEWRADRAPQGLAVTTKVFHSTNGTSGDEGLAPDRIRRQLAGSLRRLRVDRVDVYLAHEPDPRTPLSATVAAFEALRDEGLIGAWGLSNHGCDALGEALRHGRLALVQNAYSLLEREDDRDVLPFCREHGVAYVPYGPLAGGWLSGKYRRGEAYPPGSRMTQRPESYRRFEDDRVFAALDRLGEEAVERGVDRATLALAWVLARADGVVCGPTTSAQLDPVLAARTLALTADDVARIGGLFA